jgi:TRAP-type C4-dicarboxylate transport system permease large subunit
VADTAAIGSILIPAMVEEGYSPNSAAAITTTHAILGPIIPPSIIMVIYASVTANRSALS